MKIIDILNSLRKKEHEIKQVMYFMKDKESDLYKEYNTILEEIYKSRIIIDNLIDYNTYTF